MFRLIYSDNIKKDYYNLLSKKRFNKYDNDTLENIYNKFYRKLLGVSLNDLLTIEFEKLKDISTISIEKSLPKIFSYESKFQPVITEFFKKNIIVNSCSYCNIDFINTFTNSSGDLKSSFTIDHVLSKSVTPHLALSLFNLVPSCYTCNSKLKGVKDIFCAPPTSSNFDFNEKVIFKTFLNSPTLQIEDDADFDLLLKEDFTDIYKSYISLFELNGRYKYHSSKALDMIKKRQNYPDSRIRELSLLLKKSEAEIKKDLFNIFKIDDCSETTKHPFTKLFNDLSNELSLK